MVWVILRQYLITIGWAITGAIAMALSIALALRLYNVLTPGLNEMEELREGNMAVAMVMAAVVIAMGLVVAVTVIPESMAPALQIMPKQREVRGTRRQEELRGREEEDGGRDNGTTECRFST